MVCDSNRLASLQVKGAVESAKSSTGLGGLVEGLKDKINGAAITDESPAKNISDVRSSSSDASFCSSAWLLVGHP